MPNCRAPASQKPPSSRAGRPRQRVGNEDMAAAMATRTRTAEVAIDLAGEVLTDEAERRPRGW